MQNSDYYLTLASVYYNQKLFHLIKEGIPVEEIVVNPEKTLKEFSFSPAEINNLTRKISEFNPERVKEHCSNLGIKIVTFGEEQYPERLLHLYDPPVVLFCWGNLELLKTPMVGIVGARRASSYGLKVAKTFAEEIAGAGITVISGLARGIDGEAHRGAVRAGATVAVLGSGIDVPYPRENEKLYREIIKKGLIISEFLPGMMPLPYLFPVRNRLIAALAEGIVVVEAALKSGSLITARIALELGREVFAVPGMITSPLSAGTNLLLKDGARIALKGTEVLEELGFGTLFGNGFEVQRSKPEAFGLAGKILEVLVNEDLTAEEVAYRLNVQVSEVLREISFLEIKGFVKKQIGGKFTKV
ncbi:DNA processing protein DprA [Carboxydothermus islandicus]|uniref:DNA processing protein DprA n=1 Tax=Carboxydothermus islandicus TaxID=661089 RepID=A0A1L8D2M0_9THEO|nr:DNA-processing protein DprA [Carboxydothermus islandicus]GAV25331.1 DNA processing protein DprA [Carboxydothermus islandicus]